MSPAAPIAGSFASVMLMHCKSFTLLEWLMNCLSDIEYFRAEDVLRKNMILSFLNDYFRQDFVELSS